MDSATVEQVTYIHTYIHLFRLSVEFLRYLISSNTSSIPRLVVKRPEERKESLAISVPRNKPAINSDLVHTYGLRNQWDHSPSPFRIQ